MTETIMLRGYAVPFEQSAHIGDGKLEQFARGAFSEMLAQSPKIELRWGTHDDDAPKLVSSGVSFFQDDYGFGFSASVDMGWGQVSAMTRSRTRNGRPLNMVSVGGLIIKASHSEKLLLGTTEIVTEATINHLTITDSAAYRGTAVWPAHLPLDDAPYKIQDLADRWSRGNAAWTRSAAARRRPSTGLSPSVEAMFKARRGEIMRLRARASNSPSMMSAGGEIVGHLAFSAAADRIFGKLR